MRQRRETVEHPFGTMKARMGATHFLTKTLPKVAAEMALSVLAYNLNTGHEHCRGQTPDRCDLGLRHTRFPAASANIPEAVLTRPRPITDLPLRRWCTASIRAYRTDSNQAENARMIFSRG